MTLWTVGIDEAGRGPLAGPVAVGAFAMSGSFDRTLLAGIRDSKILTAPAREKWYATLTNLTEVRYAVGTVDALHIDQYGITHAIKTAMGSALDALSLSPDESRILLDGGLCAPMVYKDQTTIIRGDMTEPCISAAAILAKVTRDRYMMMCAEKWNVYKFDIHKGYGTKYHREMIRTHGLSPIHRSTFCRNCVSDA